MYFFRRNLFPVQPFGFLGAFGFPRATVQAPDPFYELFGAGIL
jgi:hypothetical protein